MILRDRGWPNEIGRDGADGEARGEDVDGSRNGRVNECEDVLRRREMDFYRQEKELAEWELELARREIAMLRDERRGDPSGHDDGERVAIRGGGASGVPRMQTRTNLATIADLLSEFDGSGNFDTWEKHLEFLKPTYQLEDNHVKILIGMRLKNKALEWFHSKSEYLSMPLKELIDKIRAMFQLRESRVAL